MAYLQDYLKVLPEMDGRTIREVLKENTEILSIKNLTEQEFEQLILAVKEKEQQLTQPVSLSEKIMAEEMNEFYSNVQLDLVHLFMEQNLLEGISENYDRIYEGNLDDMRSQIANLEQKTAMLDMEKDGEDGLVVRSYSFEPANKLFNIESKTKDVPESLWTDRDGTILKEVEIGRTFHKYHASLSKEKTNDLLKNANGQTTAKIELLYESPYVLSTINNNYDISKAIDGNDNTFWYSVALKPNNSSDKTTINPKEI